MAGDLVPTTARPPAVPGAQAEPGKIAAVFAGIRRGPLAIFADREELHRSFPRYVEVAYRVRGTPTDHLAVVERREGYLSLLPPADALQALAERAADALAAGFSRTHARRLVGLLLDSFPNARPHSPAVYFEALADQLEGGGFCPSAIARAVDQLIATCRFCPAVAELLTACEAAQESLRAIEAICGAGLEAHRRLTEALATAGSPS